MSVEPLSQKDQSPSQPTNLASPRILVWFWALGGGGSRFACNMALRLAEHFGHEAVSLSMRADDPLVERAAKNGLKVYTACIQGGRRNPVQALLNIPKARRDFEQHLKMAKPDYIVLAMNFALALPVFDIATRLGIPVIYVAHDPKPHPGDYALLWQSLSQNLVMKRSQTILAMSHHSLQLLQEMGWDQKTHEGTLSAVFPVKRHHPRPALEPSVPMKFLFLGRILYYKGLDLLIEALQPLRDNPNWTLTIAGFGPALDSIKQAVAGFPQIDTTHLGWLEDDHIDQLIAEHDLLIASYRSATQSGVIAEALADGMPVIVTPVGALAEQIGQGGYVTSTVSAQALTETLRQALQDKNHYQTLSQHALDVAQTSWHDQSWMKVFT